LTRSVTSDVEVANLHTIYVRETLLQIDSKPFHVLLVKSIVEEAPSPLAHVHVLTAETDSSSAAIITAATKQVQDVLIDRLEFFRARRHPVPAPVVSEHSAPKRNKSLLVSVAESALPAATTITATPSDADTVPALPPVPIATSATEHPIDEPKMNLERLNREQIAVNTLRLFSTLLSFHPGDKYVVENLVLRMNDGAPGISKSIAENSVLIKEFLTRVDNIHLRLAETLAAVPETSDLNAQEVMTTVYNSHVQKKLTKNKHYFSQWFAKSGDSSAGAEPSLDHFSERPFMRILPIEPRSFLELAIAKFPLTLICFLDRRRFLATRTLAEEHTGSKFGNN
jgi:hypothetical protein